MSASRIKVYRQDNVYFPQSWWTQPAPVKQERAAFPFLAAAVGLVIGVCTAKTMQRRLAR